MFKVLAAATVAALLSTTASAATFSFRGNFSSDDDVQLLNFSVGATSTVRLQSFSYAGGTQADGTVISAGGFDPILALFDGSGVYIDEQDDADSAPADPTTGASYDVDFTSVLGTGSYTVSIMQYDNFAIGPNLRDGFQRTGEGNFTSLDCSANMFCDTAGDARTSFWAFDISGVEQAEIEIPAPVPLPASAPLLLGGLLGLVRLDRRRRRQG